MIKLKHVQDLGKGGFGKVDLVVDANGEKYARKTFSINEPLTPELEKNVRRRFIREAGIQRGLSHKNIVPVVGGDLDADPPYYLMPVATSSLAEDLAADKLLGGRYLSAFSDIVAGLEELHEVEIYHRDLKPQNVLRFGDGKDAFYAIGDFGLISQKDSTVSKLTQTGMMKGSDYFTAPEITNDLRKASRQSDIYSLGCILHEMIGRDDRVPCQEIREDGDFGPILLNCTRGDPKRRFKSVKAVLDAIVSVDPKAPPLKSANAERFLKILNSDEKSPMEFWKDFVDF
jgi:serine/threonine protein kinase